ncbi:TPA: hypothetical protein DDZ86_04245 [Candidatus Dependentiae bacterium]|nr:MAG: hypothetical protein UW09_C0003G0198 [candidate division TM6 bacterium GW2011_GWF2_43_87]HBL98825.1 hypothetical protein [Candidatus Dependentiae bacterium]
MLNNKTSLLALLLVVCAVVQTAPPLAMVKNFDKLWASDEWRHRLDPLIGGIILTQKQDLIKNCLLYTKKNQPLYTLSSSLFNRINEEHSYQATLKKPFYKDLTPYLTGWLAALVASSEQSTTSPSHPTIPLHKQLHAFKAFLHKISNTTGTIHREKLENEIRKTAPALVSFAKAAKPLGSIEEAYACVNCAVKAQARSSRTFSKDKNTTLTVEIYSRDTVYNLLTAFAFDKANTKADLLEYAQGFRDHYIGTLSDVFSPLGLKILQISKKKFRNTFLQSRYSPQDALSLLNHTYPDATDNDRFYTCTNSTSFLDERIGSSCIQIANYTSADCMENTLLTNITALLRVFQTDHLKDLPHNLQKNPKIKLFFNTLAKDGLNNQAAREAWFYIFSDKEHKQNRAHFDYVHKDLFCELEPTVGNFLKAIAFFFDLKADSFAELSKKLSALMGKFTISITQQKTDSPNDSLTLEIKSLSGAVVECIYSKITPKIHASANRKTSLQTLKSSLISEIKDPLLRVFTTDIQAPPSPPSPSPSIPSIYKDLAHEEFNVLLKLFSATILENKNPKATSHYQWKAWNEAWNLSSIAPWSGELPQEILPLFATHSSEGPFKNYLENAPGYEILRQIQTFKESHQRLLFLENMNTKWMNKNSNSVVSALLDLSLLNEKDGEHFITYAEEHGFIECLRNAGYESFSSITSGNTEILTRYLKHVPYIDKLLPIDPITYILNSIINKNASIDHYLNFVLTLSVLDSPENGPDFTKFFKDHPDDFLNLDIQTRATLARHLKTSLINLRNYNKDYPNLLDRFVQACPWTFENEIKLNTTQFTTDITFDTLLIKEKKMVFGPSQKNRHAAYFYINNIFEDLVLHSCYEDEFISILKELGNQPLEGSATFADLFTQQFEQWGGMKRLNKELESSSSNYENQKAFNVIKRNVKLVEKYKQAVPLTKVDYLLDTATVLSTGLSFLPTLNPSSRAALTALSIGTTLGARALELHWPLAYSKISTPKCIVTTLLTMARTLAYSGLINGRILARRGL